MNSEDAHARAILADPRWARIVARDKTADGEFSYTVGTTGIYCRPSCASRGCNPKNVTIHDTLESAQATGFRACKRCKPDGPAADVVNAELVTRVCRMIEESETAPSLADLAEALGLSSGYLHRVFKAHTGLTPKAYANACKAKRVREALVANASVTDAIYDAGYNSSSRFYETSNALLGMTPSAYRKGGTKEDIRFAIGETSLGSILVASSAKGIAAILLGDDPEELARNLQDRFPNATLIGADTAYEEVVSKVVGFVETPTISLDLPLDVRGTAFQQRVWQALRDIPVGTTISYAAIAERVGAPSATRAVAGACAANKLALAIPCHRVVRNDGALSGYAWGVERKRAILERERAAA
ncbi:bifunctional DNA-binding transcriptional regulator/O6-methylguanine-DNA methyltransferase Ada [Novosphingobium sp. 9U]|uniref:bifunctional DNA-binding transcriptional regulator/O6-methylguanine-DNA methyltransferase Ada n=1 Tax=Novosphingobium sp. 9U TaxID=2653158 RepID=UPI0012F27F72|nr:bifunctional DNA-binding transcriptional regulator/O6-methylguanine-DNA methyltransferase Ada [Novosphingobium sp. 9U]VWX54953.1 Methylphosphotriester-DNA--protein-cysteine S-methyltransferase / Methylated-DNA--protein-cysteine methyltransferase [Novosphingobium sp. 9U]